MAISFLNKEGQVLVEGPPPGPIARISGKKNERESQQFGFCNQAHIQQS